MRIKAIIITNLIILGFLFLITTIKLESPQGEIFERKPTFQWTGFSPSYKLILDENPEFTSPEIKVVKEKKYTPKENLPLGEYYWKIIGLRESKVKKFRIISKVSIKKEDKEIINDGNTRIKLGFKPQITGAAILDLQEKANIPEKAKEVIAEQNE